MPLRVVLVTVLGKPQLPTRRMVVLHAAVEGISRHVFVNIEMLQWLLIDETGWAAQNQKHSVHLEDPDSAKEELPAVLSCYRLNRMEQFPQDVRILRIRIWWPIGGRVVLSWRCAHPIQA
jgi:hypothetical protein